ncbi:MAG TPA: DUF4157 domain-containing protein [Allosphingosinicella sp.]|jgi:hypothetical protein
MSRAPVHEPRPPLRNPSPPRLSAAAPGVQRLCKHGARTGDECAKCAAVQRKERGSAPGRRQAPEVEAVLANPGRPLPAAVRSDMEARFGRDFGAVRIHDDAAGARAADAVDAEAFAHGNDIAFAPGRFDPDTEHGRWLLAHELAHTVQQSRGAAGVQQSGPLSDGALEREADMAAVAALAFQPVPPLSAAPAQVARAGKTAAKPKPKVPGVRKTTITIDTRSYEVEMLSGEQTVDKVAEPVFEVQVAPFYVPRLKGKRAMSVLADDPPQPLLRVPKDTAARAALKQVREPPHDLRANWLRRVNWTAGEADALWKGCGGDKSFPYVKGEACHMDHIIELQLGGGGHSENIQTLDPRPNMDSGQMIRHQLAEVADAIADHPKLKLGGAGRDLMLRLRFKGVKPYGPSPSVTKCIDIESQALKAEAGNLKLLPGRQNHFLRLRGECHVSVDNKLKAKIEDDPDNDALRLSFPGLILTRLDSPVQKVHAMHARIDTETARLPLKVLKSQAKGVTLSVSPDADPKLSTNKTNIPIELLFLSPGKITEVGIDTNNKTSWKGEVTPTHRFLPKLGIAYADEKLTISTGLSKEALQKKSPIPGAKITDASVSIDLMPEFKPSGTLAFEFSPAGRKVLAASVKLFAENDALAADGNVTLFIPGVQSTTGEVKYRNGAWSMSANVAAENIDIPFLKGGALAVSYSKGVFGAQGKLDLALPGGGEGKLELKYLERRWLFVGAGKIHHKRFGTVSATLRDDGDTFEAKGKATVGLEKLGLAPQIDATFKRKRGEDRFKISGTGIVLVTKGNITGSLSVTLHESGAVSGTGKLNFPVRDSLMVEAGVTMDANQVVTTTGTVKLKKPIDLFKPRGGSHKLTLFNLEVPIPAVSAGPIGLKFGVGAGIDAGYWFGPAQLKDVEVGGSVKPFEVDPELMLALKGTVSIDAGAQLGFWIRGSLICDAGVGKATGSITVSAGIEAKGNASLITDVNYAKGVFSVAALAKAAADLNLAFGLKASVELTTFLGDWGPGAKWEWTLADFKVPTGLKFAFSAPIAYHSVNGLTLPSAQNITWQPPEKIDAGDLLTRIILAARQPDQRG